MCGSIRIGSVIQIGSHSIYLRRENLLPVQSKTPIIIFMAWTKRISFTHTHTYPGTMERRAFATHNKILFIELHVHTFTRTFTHRPKRIQSIPFHFIEKREREKSDILSFHSAVKQSRVKTDNGMHQCGFSAWISLNDIHNKRIDKSRWIEEFVPVESSN